MAEASDTAANDNVTGATPPETSALASKTIAGADTQMTGANVVTNIGSPPTAASTVETPLPDGAAPDDYTHGELSENSSTTAQVFSVDHETWTGDPPSDVTGAIGPPNDVELQSIRYEPARQSAETIPDCSVPMTAPSTSKITFDGEFLDSNLSCFIFLEHVWPMQYGGIPRSR